MESGVKRLGEEHTGEETQVRKIAIAGFIGTAIETYDLYIYGLAAAFVLGPLFFPGFSTTAQTIAAFGTFGASFIARPVGAAVFGHYGDRVSRKTMLVLSLLLMGLATFFIGLLPGYATLGIAAPILLVVLRFLQGIGFGGEWGGAVLMCAEHAPPGKRGLYASFPQLGPSVGLLIATGVFLLASAAFSGAAFESFGWRIPFLFSIVLVGVGLYIRFQISEAPVFKRAMERQEAARVPLLDVVRYYPKATILITGSMIILFGTNYIFNAWAPAYGTSELGLSRNTTLYITMSATMFMAVSVLIFSVFSDRVGRRKICLGSCALFGLWAFPMFWLIDTANVALIILAFAVLMLIYGMMYGPIAAYFSEQFPTSVRYTGISLGYNLGGILGGAFTPLIATGLFASTGASWSISLFILVMATISFVCVFLMSETRSLDFAEVDRDWEKTTVSKNREEVSGGSSMADA